MRRASLPASEPEYYTCRVWCVGVQQTILDVALGLENLRIRIDHRIVQHCPGQVFNISCSCVGEKSTYQMFGKTSVPSGRK